MEFILILPPLNYSLAFALIRLNGFPGSHPNEIAVLIKVAYCYKKHYFLTLPFSLVQLQRNNLFWWLRSKWYCQPSHMLKFCLELPDCLCVVQGLCRRLGRSFSLAMCVVYAKAPPSWVKLYWVLPPERLVFWSVVVATFWETLHFWIMLNIYKFVLFNFIRAGEPHLFWHSWSTTPTTPPPIIFYFYFTSKLKIQTLKEKRKTRTRQNDKLRQKMGIKKPYPWIDPPTWILSIFQP